MPAMSLIAVLVTSIALTPANEPNLPRQRADLMKTFASEFVTIKPGVGRFPTPATKLGAFAIAKYETTQELYELVMQQNPSRWKGRRNSVEQMTYTEAVAFCRRVTELMRAERLLPADEVVRLPTEAEWQYACRAGTNTKYSFGENPQRDGDEEPKASTLDAYAWHHGNAARNDPEVGVLKPNPWGLYDMHGYLWEYVSDPWRPSMAEPAGKVLPGSTPRTIRSGSWRDHYSLLTTMSRQSIPDHVRSDAIGFRCVKAGRAR